MLVYRSVVLLINISEFWGIQGVPWSCSIGVSVTWKNRNPPVCAGGKWNFQVHFPRWVENNMLDSWAFISSRSEREEGKSSNQIYLGSGYVSSKESTEFYGMEPSLRWLNVLSGFRPPTETVRWVLLLFGLDVFSAFDEKVHCSPSKMGENRTCFSYCFRLPKQIVKV